MRFGTAWYRVRARGKLLTQITAIFWDIGGVLLTNGWDTPTRHAAAAKFGLQVDELDARHAKAFPIYERGEISLDDYLTQSVFYRPRPFTRDEFRNFIYSCSSELSESRAFADRLAGSKQFLMAAINNEGRELNEFRIKKFDLRRTLSLFFSSCYVGLRKPDTAIYRLALDVAQRTGAESIFIDDRPENADGARNAGMNAVRFENVSQLRRDLQNFGVEIPS
jgi:putative hydrolase of the HAD superfamily